MPLTLPTILTLFRIAMLPVMVVVFYAPFRGANIAASGVFIAAALTDWLDGWVARRYRLTSAFGAFLDPVADKLMVAVTLFLIVQDNPTVPLAVISAIIVGREITISALREWMAEIGERTRVKVAGIGKIKTMAQLVALVVLLYQKDLNGFGLFHVGEVLLAVAAVLTIWSGCVYVLAAWPALRDGSAPQSGDR